MVIRGAVVPKGFGQYGHYRPGALAADPAASRCLRRARHLRAVPRRPGQGPRRRQARPRRLRDLPRSAGQACRRPGGVKPKLPDGRRPSARRCHEKDAAKPKTFPQVVTAEHSGGMACNDCHKPHNPHL